MLGPNYIEKWQLSSKRTAMRLSLTSSSSESQDFVGWSMDWILKNFCKKLLYNHVYSEGHCFQTKILQHHYYIISWKLALFWLWRGRNSGRDKMNSKRWVPVDSHCEFPLPLLDIQQGINVTFSGIISGHWFASPPFPVAFANHIIIVRTHKSLSSLGMDHHEGSFQHDTLGSTGHLVRKVKNTVFMELIWRITQNLVSKTKHQRAFLNMERSQHFPSSNHQAEPLCYTAASH